MKRVGDAPKCRIRGIAGNHVKKVTTGLSEHPQPPVSLKTGHGKGRSECPQAGKAAQRQPGQIGNEVKTVSW